MSDVMPAVAIVSLFAIVGWIIRSTLEYRRNARNTRLQAELQRQLIEKMGTGADLLAYLQSDAGARLVSSVALERGNPLLRILGAVQAGIILTVIGVAVLLLRNLSGLGTDGVTGFTFLGTLSIAVGAGFLISAVATYALSKRWGLVDRGAARAAEG